MIPWPAGTAPRSPSSSDDPAHCAAHRQRGPDDHERQEQRRKPVLHLPFLPHAYRPISTALRLADPSVFRFRLVFLRLLRFVALLLQTKSLTGAR